LPRRRHQLRRRLLLRLPRQRSLLRPRPTRLVRRTQIQPSRRLKR
jgi:hypothetical protein